MGSLAGRIDEAGQLLTAERAVLSEAADRLKSLAETDCSGFSREQFADHTIELVAATQIAVAASGGFVAVGEETACSLTKGESSMTAALNAHCRISRRHSSQLDLVGSAAARYPAFYQAMLDGLITGSHIEVVHRVWRRISRAQFNAAEADLCELAGMCTPEEFADYLAQWEAHADETDALDKFIERQGQQHCTYGFDVFGSLHYSGTVGPEHAEPFMETIEAEAQNHKTADNLPSQALGDAVVELVLNPDGKYRAHLEVLVPEHQPPCHDLYRAQEDAKETDLEVLKARWKDEGRAVLNRYLARATEMPVPNALGFSHIYYPQTARGTLIPPAVVNRMESCGARVRAHTVDDDGNIVGDSHRGRHFNTIQKRMIQLRDHRCRHPGCRRTICEFDHVEPAEHGGPTLIRNGQLLCRMHHRWKHRHDPRGSAIFNDGPLLL